jgi:RNA polymerase sigma factor (TIGR02999 family)
MSSTDEVTRLLNEMNPGSESSPERLLELVYDDLRRLAGAYMQNERSDHTLQATALVHEAYMRLVDWKNVSWQNRAQFFSVAAEVMRKVLIDHARARASQKRFGHKLVLDEAVSLPDRRPIDLIALDEALIALEKLDPRQAKIVELRFFGGLTIEETAYILQVSERTVRREWTFAKAWFQRELGAAANN